MKHLKTALKIAFVIGLLYFLMSRGFISLKDTKRAFHSWHRMTAAVAVLGVMVVMGAVRWQWLLRAQDIHLTWFRALELTLVGNFFNIALPGAVSGDFVKAYYIGQSIPGRRGRAFGSILFDRVAGLTALVMVSGVALILANVEGLGAEGVATTLKVLTPFVVFCALGVVFLYGYLFFMKEHWDPILKALKQLEAKWQKAGSLTRIYEGLRHYHHHRFTVFKVFAISIFVHLSVGWTLLQFAHALGEPNLPPLGVYTVFPLCLLVTAVPVAPAGVGTGHAAFLYFFKLIGSQRGADIFTLYALSQITYGALGGIIYLRFKSHGDAVQL